MRSALKVSVIVCVLLSGLVPAQAQAFLGLQPGIRGGIYEDGNDFFLGVDLKTSLAILHANPNLEWVFVDNANVFTLNLDALFNIFPLPLVDVWGGGGFGVFYAKPDDLDSTSDFAVNLLAGLGFNVLLDPYVQIKYVITDDNTLVFAAGIRF
jgi:hypothetical protein